jgi:D-glycero-D-manno-heptose 1,7-bisphosphate phosphatase
VAQQTDAKIIAVPVGEGRTQDWTLRPVLVLDLDQTVRFNKDDPQGFINSPDEIAIYEGVEAKLWEYRNRGWIIAGVTNQGGVAHGYKPWQSVNDELDATSECFESNPFHTMQACWHDPTGNVEPFCHRSVGRKPDVGMLAYIEHELWDERIISDWDHSLVVGDREEDRKLAENAGISFAWAHVFFDRPKP